MHTKNTILSRVGLLLIPLVVLSVSQAAWAEAVNVKSLQAAVETWVRHVTADARVDAFVERLEPYVSDGEVAAYIAHLAGGGYCICGADTRLLPVYLYRPVGQYDPTNPNYQHILKDIARRLSMHNGQGASQATSADYGPILAQRASDWADLMAERVPSSVSESGPALSLSAGAPSLMTLPVTSRWHQGSPYNDLCPELEIGNDWRAVTGCVATTAAQIMYYWKWPASGVGSGSVEYNRRTRTGWDYESLPTDPQLESDPIWTNRLSWGSEFGRLYMSGVWDGSIYYSGAQGACNNGTNCSDASYLAALETLWDRMPRTPEICSADFSLATYDYTLMKDSNSDPPDASTDEAAKLSYHAGIAVGMQYGVYASTAGTTRNALVDHFQYDSSAVGSTLDENAVIEEIQWLRPVEITGASDAGGHSWIIAGYNTGVTPTQYLMNMGWGGGTTEWNTLDQVFPNSQGTTTRIAPQYVVKFVGAPSPGNGSPSAPFEDLDFALTYSLDNSTLIFQAGTTHTATGDPIVIDKPLTLKGHDVTISRSAS